MATLKHAKGRTVVVPDETVEYYVSKGWFVDGEQPAPAEPKGAKSKAAKGAIPEGDPSESWTNPQLDAYAKSRGIDLGKPKNKGERLKAIAAAREGQSGDASDEAGETGE